MGSPTCPYCMQRVDRCACEDPRIVGYENATPTPPAPADDASGAEAMDDEAANIEQRIGALDKARPGYIARLVRGICGKPVAYICVECGALWRKVKIPSDTAESWNMVSAKGCAGCDNGPKPLFDALYREPVSPARPTNDATVEEAARAAFIAYHRDYYGPAKWDYEAEWIRRTSTPNDPVVARWERIARAALRGAEYDALVSRADKPLDHVMRTSCGHEWTVRHTSCPTCFAALRAERDSLVRERDEAAAHEENAANETAELAQMIYGTASKMGVLHPDASTGAALRAMHNAYDAATARAEKAERERDDARAALDAQIATVLAAHLDAPTDDDRPTEADRRGEDGA